MPSKPNPRNHRNNPYTMDRLAVQMHHSAAGTLWRFRTELAILTSGIAAVLTLARTASWMWALIILAGLVLAVFALPWTRRYVIRRAWCVHLPAPAAAGVLRDPHAHPVRPPVPDPVDPADSGG